MVTLTLNVPIKIPAYKENVYNFLSIKISLAIVIAKGVGGGAGGVGMGCLPLNPPASTAYDTFTGSCWSAYNSLRQMRNSLVLMCCKINNILCKTS